MNNFISIENIVINLDSIKYILHKINIIKISYIDGEKYTLELNSEKTAIGVIKKIIELKNIKGVYFE